MQRHLHLFFAARAHLPLQLLVGAPVPDVDLAAAVAALGDLAREVDVLQRVVLHMHGQVVALGIGRDALGHRPADQHAVALQPEIPVQAGRMVLLDHEARALGRGALGRGSRPALGLLGAAEVALASVLTQLPHEDETSGYLNWNPSDRRRIIAGAHFNSARK